MLRRARAGAPPGGLVSGDDSDAWNVNLRYAFGFGLSVGGYYEWHLEDAWNRHDVDALMSFMTEDCVFEASAGSDVCGTRDVGRKAGQAGFVEVWATFPDAHWGNARPGKSKELIYRGSVASATA